MKTLILLALVLGIPVAAMGANPTLTNFNARHFIVDPLALPTNVITLHLNSEQFDTGGSDITITNVFGPGTTNIFQTFITTNITAVTEYVTNLYVTYLVSSNSISGNIQGTPPHLSMFFPDNFSLADSIITQNADTNGVTVNGSGVSSLTLGTADFWTITQDGTSLSITNASGPQLGLTLDGHIKVGGSDTNLLRRSGNDLHYVNGGADNSLVVTNSNLGTYGKFGIKTSGDIQIVPSSGTMWLQGAVIAQGNVVPDTNARNLGLTNSPTAWTNVASYGYTLKGLDDGLGNYSWVQLRHTGNNGAAFFDSLAGGTGTVRPFAFTNAPVMLPYVTKAAKTALTAIDGMVIYQTDNTPGLRVYVGGTWYMLPLVADP